MVQILEHCIYLCLQTAKTNTLIIIRYNLQLESNSPQILSLLGNDSISNEAKIRLHI